MAKVTPIKAGMSAGGDFEIAPEGVYLARCYKMVDVGTQTSTGQYGTKENRTLYLYWELLKDDEGDDVFMEDGKTAYSIFNSYTLSMHQKATLRKHLDSWRGKKFTDEEAGEFDLTKLLGATCKLQISHSKSKDGTKTYANVNAIMSTKKKADGINEISSFNIEQPDMDVFNDLPEWLQKKIEQAPEWQVTEADQVAVGKKASQKADEEDDDDSIDINDVPF